MRNIPLLSFACLFCLSIFLAGCEDNANEPMDQVGLSEVHFQPVFSSLSFTRPVFLTHAGDGSNRIFVVEQAGIISTFTASNPQKEIFLDIQARVKDTGNEQGLLGLAFHPDFDQNGFFYVNYINGNNASVISRFETMNNEGVPGSEIILLTVDHPYTNHNGGMLAFGLDGMLYIGLGDGGSAGDPENNGQDRTTLLGSILRIDVDNAQPGLDYSIPGDNPFVGNNQGFREEIYAYGLRNPWRFSIDRMNGNLFAGDVGQNSFEEIDLIINGGNYGWNIYEASSCFTSGCDEQGLIFPIAEYDHSKGVSVTGGYVYRGADFPGLQGFYFYGDYVSGRVWAFNASQTSPSVQFLEQLAVNISSFGEDEQGELYIVDHGGSLLQLVEKN